MLQATMQDVRYTIRQWRRVPGFVLIVVAVLALGLGANIAVPTLLNGILLRPLLYVLASSSFFAAWLPARRAVAVDPILALRSE